MEVSSGEVVSVRNVSLNYFTPERETLALDNINLSIAEGDFVAIVGSSGCGKSTLLSLIAGLIFPSAGKVDVFGKEVSSPSPRLGYMLQKDTLLEWRTVIDNVVLGSELLRRNLVDARARASALLHSYGMGDFVDSLPAQLSGGMRQRVALARTLCSKPDLLLLDEPFSALDFQTRLALSDDMFRILRDEKKTAILVTHDIGEAISMANRVIVMSRRPGRIKSEHKIEFPSSGGHRPLPLAARECPEFNDYFRTIWNELDLHEVD